MIYKITFDQLVKLFADDTFFFPMFLIKTLGKKMN